MQETETSLPTSGQPGRAPNPIIRAVGSIRALRVAAITLVLLYGAMQVLPHGVFGLGNAALVISAFLFLGASVFRSVLWPLAGLLVLGVHMWWVYEMGQTLPKFAEVGRMYEGMGVEDMEAWVANIDRFNRAARESTLSLLVLACFWIHFAATTFCLWRVRVNAERAAETAGGAG